MKSFSLPRPGARYLVPLGAAAITAAIVVVPQAASGAQHPDLPARTAAQLLNSLERAKLPQFSGTTVETARLGLPSISEDELPAGVTPDGQSQLMQLVTLLTGSHTAQIAYGGPDKQRVAIFLSDLSETDVVHNGPDIWTYSSDSNTVTHNTVKQSKGQPESPSAATAVDPTTSTRQALAAIDPSTKVAVDRTAEVAGRPAYQVDLNPRDPRTLISSVRIALDSTTSMPLRVQIWSRKSTTAPAFSVAFTSISLSAPSASTFTFSKPPSAVTAPAPFSADMFGSSPAAMPGHAGARSGGTQRPELRMIGKDWTTVLVAKLHDNAAAGTAPQTAGVLPQRTQVRGATPPAGGPRPARAGAGGLTQELDQLGTRVAGGHILTTSLLTIFLTNDNRILIGAVTPSQIEQLATRKAAQ